MFKFIDLFCGVGGFHQALRSFGGECVFACDVDKKAIGVYEKNYGIKVHNDITTVDEKTLPDFDFLCGGFPCQPFSKCGKRGGFNDTRGTLFFDILRILKEKKPTYILLENVANLVHHDNGNTYKIIISSLKEIGYQVTEKPLFFSPDKNGTPQHRNRIFILGKYNPTHTTALDVKLPITILTKTIYDYLDVNNNDSSLKINNKIEDTINAWDEFFQYYRKNPNGPRNFFLECIYNHYPLKIRQRNYKDAIMKYYIIHQKFIDAWVTKHNMLLKPITHQHWFFHHKPQVKSLWDCIIQPRANGFIYTQMGICPTLVKSGIPPIIGKFKRHMSSEEYCKLQDFPSDFIPHTNAKDTYKQMGNAVNVNVIKTLVKVLLDTKSTNTPSIFDKFFEFTD